MKAIFTFIFLLSNISFADDLLKYTYSVGFSPDPIVETIILQNDGKLIQHAEYTVSKKSISIQLAEISPLVTQKIQSKILHTDVTAQLVDKNENDPRCMDGPFISVSVIKNSQETVIHKNSQCHTYELDDQNANILSELMMNLVALGRL